VNLTKEQFGITSEKMFNFAIYMFDPGSETYDNGTQSARMAGYKGNDNTLAVTANQYLRKPKVIAVKQALHKQLKTVNVANRRKRQEFWTNMMLNAKSDADKLRASELLGRSEADFTDRVIADNTFNIEVKRFSKQIDAKTLDDDVESED
jgi:hypothetical protein